MTTTDDPDAWRQHAECRGMDPEFFYPERGEDVDAIKAVCATCPVRAQCLEYAITHREMHGIWGGLSERQRRRIRSHRIVVTRDLVVTCGICAAPFVATSNGSKYCGEGCRSEATRLSKERWEREKRAS
jgi:WhiB family redox-sensing transcriptional regulator